jgi:hypothetical protein
MVKLVHLDGNVRSMRDDGCNQEGRPNQQRAHMLAMLSKRVAIPNIDPKLIAECEAGRRPFSDIQVDGPVMFDRGEGGKEIMLVPVFRLAEPPPRFPYERLPEKVRGSIQAADVMTQMAPFRDGESGAWALPSERWKAHSAAWRAWKKKNGDATRQMLDDAARATAGEALEKLLKIASKRGGGTNVAA